MASGARWRPVPVPDFGPLYEVSDAGEVRRVGADRPLTPSVVRGRPTVWLKRPGRTKGVGVARLVAGAFLGPPPEPRAVARPRDGDPGNCRAENLRWARAGAGPYLSPPHRPPPEPEPEPEPRPVTPRADRPARGHWPRGRRRNPDVAPPPWGTATRLVADLAEMRATTVLCARLRVDRKTWWRWASGTDLPSPEMVARLVAAHRELSRTRP